MQQYITIVNKALEVYHATPVEQYPEARAIDKLEELTPPNSRERQYCYNLLQYALSELTQ